MALPTPETWPIFVKALEDYLRAPAAAVLFPSLPVVILEAEKRICRDLDKIRIAGGNKTA
jgi:hypothetical protein